MARQRSTTGLDGAGEGDGASAAEVGGAVRVGGTAAAAGTGAMGTDGVATGAGEAGGAGAGVGAAGGGIAPGATAPDDTPGAAAVRFMGPRPKRQGAGRGVRAGGAMGHHAQGALDHLCFGAVDPAHVFEPPRVAEAVVDPLQAAGNAPGQGQGNLRAEAGGQVDRELDGIAPAARQVERAQLGVRLLEVGHRGHDSVLEDLHSDDVLDAHAHRVPGEALRVGHHDLIGGGAEHVPQGHHLRGGAAAARGGEGLVGDEDHLGCHGHTVEAVPPLGRGHEALHHAGDVLDVEARGVEGAVCGLGGEQLHDPPHPPLLDRVLALHHHGAGAHPHQRPVPTAVEGKGRLLDLVVGGDGTGGKEAGADPLHQVVAGRVVATHHDDAPAASGADPVLGESHTLGRRRTGGVDVGVRAAGPYELRELAVAHGENAEEKAAVEDVGIGGNLLVQLADAPLDLAERLGIPGDLAQILQGLPLGDAALVGVVPPGLVREAVEAGEGAREDDAGLVAQRLGQEPSLGKVLAGGGLAVGLDQRDPGLAQGVDAGGHRQLGRGVQGLDQLVGHAVLGGEIERAGAAGELDDVLRVVDELEVAAAVGTLDEARHALPGHEPALALGDQLHELLAAQDPLGVARVHEGLVHPGQAETCTADDDRTLGGVVAVVGTPFPGREGLQRFGEQALDLVQGRRGSRAPAGGRRGVDRSRLARHDRRPRHRG